MRRGGAARFVRGPVVEEEVGAEGGEDGRHADERLGAGAQGGRGRQPEVISKEAGDVWGIQYSEGCE